jgi:rhodanese-related sulfurtransferase
VHWRVDGWIYSLKLRNIPLGQLIRKRKQSGLDDLKGKTICTYRNGGYRGNIGADELNKKGFTTVTIDGGYEAWKEERKMPDDKIG